MSQALAPLVWTLAGLLALAGLAKLRDPQATVRALVPLGLRVPRAGVRVLGLCEVALGIVCLVSPSALVLAALALAYLVFAGVVAAMVRAGGAEDCGCFGERSFAPSAPHAALDLVAALAAGLAATAPPPGLGAGLPGDPLQAAAVALGVVAAIGLAFLVFTALPDAWTAYGGSERRGAS